MVFAKDRTGGRGDTWILTPSTCGLNRRSWSHKCHRSRALSERTATFLAMALAASALLHPALCADAPRGRAPRTPPWHNPCGRTTILPRLRQRHQQRQQQQQQQRQLRQLQQLKQQEAAVAAAINSSQLITLTGSWSLRNVRAKMKIAKGHLRNEWKTIKNLYGSIVQVGLLADFPWLPRNQLRWYRKEVACLDRNSQAAIVLPVLHSSLQNFSATMEELRKPRKIAHFDLQFEMDRIELMKRIAAQVKGVLCEVETSLTERSLPRPPPLNENDFVIHRRVNSITESLVEDWTVISAFGNALAEWVHLLRQLGLAKKVPRGETATQRPCSTYKPPETPNPSKKKGKDNGKHINAKDKVRPSLRPGQRKWKNRHSRRRDNLRGRLSVPTTSTSTVPPLS